MLLGKRGGKAGGEGSLDAEEKVEGVEEVKEEGKEEDGTLKEKEGAEEAAGTGTAPDLELKAFELKPLPPSPPDPRDIAAYTEG